MTGAAPRLGVFTARGKRLCRVDDQRLAHPRTQLLHDAFRATVLSNAYPCVLGSSVLRHDNYAFAVYSGLGEADAAARLAADLEWFVHTDPLPRTRRRPRTLRLGSDRLTRSG